jgi:hypothetical protein
MSHPGLGEQAETGSTTSGGGRRWLSIALVLLLIGAGVGVAGAWAGRQGLRDPESTTTAKAPTGSGLGSQHLTLHAKVIDGPLVPGVRRTLRIRVSNDLSYRIELRRIAVATKRPPAVGCKPKWVQANDFGSGNKQWPLIIRGNSRGFIKLPIRLKNLPNVNQDACKNTTFPLRLTAQARPAR